MCLRLTALGWWICSPPSDRTPSAPSWIWISFNSLDFRPAAAPQSDKSTREEEQQSSAVRSGDSQKKQVLRSDKKVVKKSFWPAIDGLRRTWSSEASLCYLSVITQEGREGAWPGASANQGAASEDWLLLSSLLIWTVTDVGHGRLELLMRRRRRRKMTSYQKQTEYNEE